MMRHASFEQRPQGLVWLIFPYSRLVLPVALRRLYG